MITIIVADDQMLIREGLKTILDLEDDMEVVALAKDGKEACELTAKLQPKLVMMDIQMPNLDGLSALKYIKSNFPTIHVLILSTFLHEQYILEGMGNGASGYILKDMDTDKMIESIRNTVDGQLVLPGTVAAKLVHSIMAKNNSIRNNRWHLGLNLTEREREIAELISEGFSSKVIAARLFITDGTVRNYISTIYQKLEVVDRDQAIAKVKALMKN